MRCSFCSNGTMISIIFLSIVTFIKSFAYNEKWLHQTASLNPLTDQWHSMSIDEAMDYYTAHDLCSLVNRNTYPTSCKYIPGFTGHECVCKMCSHTAYPLLQRHITTHPWPESKGLLELLLAMKKKGSNTIFLIGDSVSRQLIEFTACDLKKLGLYIRTVNYEFSNRKKTQYINIYTSRANLEAGEAGIAAYRIVYIPDSYYYYPDFGAEIIPTDLGGMNYIHEYLHNNPFSNGSQVFICNYGLHYTPLFGYDEITFKRVTDRFVSVMETLLDTGHTVMFRESSAQHFPTEDGRFITRYSRGYNEERSTISKTQLISGFSSLSISNITKPNTVIYSPSDNPIEDYYYCTAIRNESMITHQNWQTPIILDKLHRHLESGRMGFIYFFNVTAGRHDLHVGELGDCTHYCASPMIWYPIWEQAVLYYLHRYQSELRY